jgi:heme-binding uptake protein ChaN (Tiki superfamily)
VLSVSLWFIVLPFALHADPLADYLRQSGKSPAEYVLSKLDGHRIVIAGENHWQRKDAELIAALVPDLHRRNVALAMEVLLASSQSDIDKLIAAEEWDQALANKIMQVADWPYVQYRDILRQAWKAKLKIIAIGPPEDWRKQGIRYDEFMATRVRDYATDDAHRVLVYCGMHHAFTRYLQVERYRNGHASEFMDRMGNILWRQFAQDVFLIALHKPSGCGTGESAFATLCAPLGGVIDCAAVANGSTPAGFDILGSPIAQTQFDAKDFYAKGHPLLRMIDYADGYVWQQPVDEITMVEVISPEDPAWEKRAADLANPKKRASWATLPEWRAACRKIALP